MSAYGEWLLTREWVGGVMSVRRGPHSPDDVSSRLTPLLFAYAVLRSMHFIGMMAMSVHDSDGRMLPMGFEPGLTVLSAILPALIIGTGFLIAGNPSKPKRWKNILAGVAGGIGVSVMRQFKQSSLLFALRAGRGRLLCSAHSVWLYCVCVCVRVFACVRLYRHAVYGSRG